MWCTYFIHLTRALVVLKLDWKEYSMSFVVQVWWSFKYLNSACVWRCISFTPTLHLWLNSLWSPCLPSTRSKCFDEICGDCNQAETTQHVWGESGILINIIIILAVKLNRHQLTPLVHLLCHRSRGQLFCLHLDYQNQRNHLCIKCGGEFINENNQSLSGRELMWGSKTITTASEKGKGVLWGRLWKPKNHVYTHTWINTG